MTGAVIVACCLGFVLGVVFAGVVAVLLLEESDDGWDVWPAEEEPQP